MNKTLGSTPNFEGWRAAILHRPHEMVQAMCRQLAQIGVEGVPVWPDLPQTDHVDAFDIVLFDADMGHESQFGWAPGEAPMPTIALIGSEAPGRLAWAIAQGADAHLLKPVGSAGVFSAIVMAAAAHGRRQALTREADVLQARLARRECVAAATALLMLSENLDAGAAYRRLRLLAMDARRTIEDMSEQMLARSHGGRRERGSQ